MSSPLDVGKLLQDALDTQSTIVGQPNDNNLLALKEKAVSAEDKILNGLQVMVGALQKIHPLQHP